MSIRMKKRKKRVVRSRRVLEHRLSIILISCVIVIMAVVLSVASISLRSKWRSQETQITELKKELKEEQARSEEIDEKEEYVGTKEHIEDVARETGLVYPNEILFEAE